MLVRAHDGSFLWGKYYQNKQVNATVYMGLFYACKFQSDQKILVSGQANFYKGFIGSINVTDGNFIDTMIFQSNDKKYSVSYSSYSLDVDAAGYYYAGVSFLGSASSFLKVKPSVL